MLGIWCIALSVTGPLASRAHTDFADHMIIHLLLGMLAPLLLMLAAPMTLLFRTLSLKQARGLSRLLKSSPFRLLHNPFTASTLHIGGLWLLYTTDIYSWMHRSTIGHTGVHVHIFLAGYLFTASMVSIDPAPHRTSFLYRSLVLLIALSAHGILSKYLYAHPPSGVPAAQAELGSMIMYYGGDIVDIVLICILFSKWFHAARPRKALNPVTEK
ncbi:cytochrome c oxidase assembly protein [Paenibacillus hexagrammi]|uniref:Cytochrome c oxidase assembly protein n=2 Tax=Paenibacillus hexagrammi TaxID=2908839 RepID=A0ABY3SRX2_9BACL|nr:cytochrome c oxidase assembly protein [Paenibacillus sp. YPD9-1]UJF36208.1 cytochrome c oxidase assembly protein [Paenibacillus sp. YPD9-1]